MTQEDVFLLFGEEALKLKKSHARQKDLLISLADVIASSQDSLSQESIDALIRIGAALYRSHAGQVKARADIANTMRESHERARD